MSNVFEKEPLTGMLTGVYHGVDFVLPAEWTVYASIPPIYENGVIRLVGMKQTEQEAEDGTITEEIEYKVFTIADGQIKDTVPLAVPGDETLEKGAFSCRGDWYAFIMSWASEDANSDLLIRIANSMKTHPQNE